MLLYPEESYKITGAIYEVHKELGPGLLEKVYQEALEKELKLQGIPFEREKSLLIFVSLDLWSLATIGTQEFLAFRRPA